MMNTITVNKPRNNQSPQRFSPGFGFSSNGFSLNTISPKFGTDNQNKQTPPKANNIYSSLPTILNPSPFSAAKSPASAPPITQTHNNNTLANDNNNNNQKPSTPLLNVFNQNLNLANSNTNATAKNDSGSSPFKKTLSCDVMESDSGMRKFEERLRQKKESEAKFMNDETIQKRALDMWKSNNSTAFNKITFNRPVSNNNLTGKDKPQYIPTAQNLLQYKFPPKQQDLLKPPNASADKNRGFFKKALSDASMHEASIEFSNFLGFLESIQALIFLRGLKVSIKNKCKDLAKEVNWQLKDLEDSAAAFSTKETILMIWLEKAKEKYPLENRYVPQLTGFLFLLIEKDTKRTEQKIVKALGLVMFLKRMMKKLKLENNIVSKKGKKKNLD